MNFWSWLLLLLFDWSNNFKYYIYIYIYIYSRIISIIRISSINRILRSIRIESNFIRVEEFRFFSKFPVSRSIQFDKTYISIDLNFDSNIEINFERSRASSVSTFQRNVCNTLHTDICTILDYLNLTRIKFSTEIFTLSNSEMNIGKINRRREKKWGIERIEII